MATGQTNAKTMNNEIDGQLSAVSYNAVSNRAVYAALHGIINDREETTPGSGDMMLLWDDSGQALKKVPAAVLLGGYRVKIGATSFAVHRGSETYHPVALSRLFDLAGMVANDAITVPANGVLLVDAAFTSATEFAAPTASVLINGVERETVTLTSGSNLTSVQKSLVFSVEAGDVVTLKMQSHNDSSDRTNMRLDAMTVELLPGVSLA